MIHTDLSPAVTPLPKEPALGSESDFRPALLAAATHFYHQGWMVGTAGNLSVRAGADSFWITASGRAKGRLTLTDLIRVGLDGTVLERFSPTDRPSAETSIHQVIYGLFPEAQACYHVHSVEANLASRFTQDDNLPLPPLEMLKGLGVWEENPQVVMPVFANHLDVGKIAKEMGDRLSHRPPAIPALLIRDHGVTVWGHSPEAAFHHIEIAEYLFRYLVTAHPLTPFPNW